jgi:catechol 2,3-dioxygenase-like lactoylglutathione lyase family enzyme
MSRVQLALRVADLEASVAFYSKLFDTAPAKRRPGYANFAITEPPLKLVLLEGQPGEETRMDHLGTPTSSRPRPAGSPRPGSPPRSRTTPPVATPCRTRSG